MKNQYLPEVNEMFEDADRTRDENEETLDKACKKSKEEMSQDSSKENQFPFDNEPPVNYDQLPGFYFLAQYHMIINMILQNL